MTQLIKVNVTQYIVLDAQKKIEQQWHGLQCFCQRTPSKIPTIDRILVTWFIVLLLQNTVNDIYNRQNISGMIYNASVTGHRQGYLQQIEHQWHGLQCLCYRAPSRISTIDRILVAWFNNNHGHGRYLKIAMSTVYI